MSEFVRVQKIVDAQEDSVFLWGCETGWQEHTCQKRLSKRKDL